MKPLKPMVLTLGTLAWIHSLIPLPVTAQVVPDASLPRRSQVEQTDDVFVITAGTRVQDNLFHSFRAFSISRSQRASFQNIDPSIERIITRVTGRSESFINGTIEALQSNGAVSNADLFLMNPVGIIFGRNASLNVGGSFIASTADRILFDDGAEFRADGTQSSLLTVNVPIGLQFGPIVGSIQNSSDIGFDLDDEDVPIAGGLEVLSGQTLAFIGGDITFPGGIAIAPNGRIEMGSVGPGSVVTLSPDGRGWAFNYDQVQHFQTVTLDFGALNASGERGGEVRLYGDRIQLIDEALIQANTESGRGLGITLQGGTILLDNDSRVQTSTVGDGRGGDITVQGDRIYVDGFSLIRSDTHNNGRGGTINVSADRVLLRNGGQVGTGTFGAGQGGTLNVVATEFVEVSGGEGVVLDGNDTWFASNVFTRVEGEATGQGGNLSITTEDLSVLDGAQVFALTFGRGNAGQLRVSASTVDVIGSALQPNGSLFIETDDGLPVPSGLFTNAQPQSTGNSNDVIITVDRLSVRDGGVIRTGTFSSGRSGNLIIDADVVEVIGTDINDFAPSTLFAASGGIPGITPFRDGNATGSGGTVEINTNELHVSDGGAIAVGALENSAAAGNLNIRARLIRLDEGNLVAETTATDGGDITLNTVETLVMTSNSLISTSAGLADSGGNGGIIRINANFIVSAIDENNDIRANAFDGNGGRIIINSQGIIGIEPQDAPTPYSDITASSERGVNGTIQITAVEDTLEQRQVELPSNLVDASRLVAQGCDVSGQIAQQPQGEFFSTGRGGVVPMTTSVMNTSDILDDLQRPSMWDATHSASSESSHVEAQGWLIGEQGDVMLIAELPPTMSQSICQW